jgi:Arc/MetJ family transcription regulator
VRVGREIGVDSYDCFANILTYVSIQETIVRMRTTLDLPEHLVETARRELGFKSKTDTVVLALTELVRRRRVDQLKDLLGRVDLELDIPASRRRPRRP